MESWRPASLFRRRAAHLRECAPAHRSRRRCRCRRPLCPAPPSPPPLRSTASGAPHLRRAPLLLLLHLSLLLARGETHVIHVKVGALFEEAAHEQANMFIRAIQMINEAGAGATNSSSHSQSHSSAWPAAWPAGRTTGARRPGNGPPPAAATAAAATAGRAAVKLEPMIEFLAERESAYEADNKACQLIESGARAIVGPSRGAARIQHVQSICDTMEIPYLEIQQPPLLQSAAWQDSAELGAGGGGAQVSGSAAGERPPLPARPTVDNDLTLNLYPPARLLARAYIELISAWNWSSFAIVYDDSHSILRLQDLFRESSGQPTRWTSRWRISLFQLQPESGGAKAAAPGLSGGGGEGGGGAGSAPETGAATFRSLFWAVRRAGERNILLDVRPDSLQEALKQAQQVGCMTEHYSFLVASLDLHTLELDDFKYSRARISGYSLLQPARGPFAPAGHPDDLYLKRLGVPVLPSLNSGGLAAAWRAGAADWPAADGAAWQPGALRHSERLSPSVVLRKSASGFYEPTGEAAPPARPSGGGGGAAADSWELGEHELSGARRLARLGLAGSDSGDGDSGALERLFELLVGEQERRLARVRLSTASALLHDSLHLLALALRQLAEQRGAPEADERESEWRAPLACVPGARPWTQGSSLANYLRQASLEGLTGRLALDARGQRSELRLHLLAMAPDLGLVKVGEWLSPNAGSAGGAAAGAEQPGAASAAATAATAGQYKARLADYQRRLAAAAPNRAPVHYDTAPAGAGSGGLRVNEAIYERLYRDRSQHVDTLIVTSKMSLPYFMLKEASEKLEGNDQYEGYAVDVIHELSKLINFKYRWREVADKNYGVRQVLPNGSVTWNGIIGEIIRGEADLAILDLSITAQREEAVDFTLPFMNTGISILFKRPTTKVTTLFSFLSPFSSNVWAYVVAAYCGISGVLYLVGRLSPYEWSDSRPCRHSAGPAMGPAAADEQQADERLYLDNQFTLLNSFWFTIGSLMQQGSDLTPRSMSTRTIAGIWYFFTLIMISSYTANLAAFLTVEKTVFPIESVHDLVNQQEIKYGCVDAGSTKTFFQDSKVPTYRRLYENMERHATFAKSNRHGTKRVEEGGFAFFMESTTIEYLTERNCNLTQIGGLLDSKGYGMATSKTPRFKRPYRMLLSEGILHLQESGLLHTLKRRWWKEKRGGGTCADDSKGGGVTELSLANVGGVFVVLLGGCAISFLVAFIEFMWSARRKGSTRDSLFDQMMSEIKFALSCKHNTRPAARGSASRRPRAASPASLSSLESASSAACGPPAGRASRHAGPLGRLQPAPQPRPQEVRAGPARRGPSAPTPAPASRRGVACADQALLRSMLTLLAQQQGQLAGERPEAGPRFSAAGQRLLVAGERPAGALPEPGRAPVAGLARASEAVVARRRLLLPQRTVDSAGFNG